MLLAPTYRRAGRARRPARAGAARALVPVALAAALAGACAADDPPVQAQSVTTVSDAEPTGGTTGTTAALTGPPSTAEGAAPAADGEGQPGRCRPADVHVELGDVGAAAGHRYQPLIVTNTAAAPCDVGGFPGVSLLDDGGGQVAAPADRQPLAVEPVVLAPGVSASAVIDRRSPEVFAPDDCGGRATVTGLRVYLPDSTEAVTLPVSFEACTGRVGQLSVAPFRVGRDSQP